MCPAAGLTPLRVAPEDVEMADAGEMVKDLGIYNQAKGLQQAVAKQMPKDLRIAMQRYEHTQRSKFLDADEVLARAQEAIVEEGGTPEVIARVVGARVRGDKNDPFDGAVIIQYETPNLRVGYCAALYSPLTFPASVQAYDDALREGKTSLPGDIADRGSLRTALDQREREIGRLANEVRELQAREQAGLEADDAPPEGSEPADPAAGEATPPSDDPVPPAVVELPEGVDPGDPGYPVDEETGEVLALPDSVRQSLIASAEREEGSVEQSAAAEQKIAELQADAEKRESEYAAQTAKAEQDRQAEVAKLREEADAAEAEVAAAPEWPEDLSTVELPQGKSEVLIAGLPYYSTLVVAALAEHGEAKATREAAATELATRTDKPEPAVDPTD